MSRSAYSSSNISRHDQDWNAALAGAEAGIDDYIFRINENSNYWQYNATNPPPTSDPNAAFTELGRRRRRHRTPRSTATASTCPRWASTAASRSPRRAASATRSARVYATLRRRSFLDFLYFTDIEARDPAQYTGSPFDQLTAQTSCGAPKHYYGGSGAQRDIDGRTDYAGDADPPSCTEINFITADSINGPLHTNDAFRVCGSPNFNGDTSTSWDGSSGGGTGVRYRQTCTGSGSPDFANPGDPKFAPPLIMPPSNSAIRAETNAGKGGCLYTGPTRIRLNGDGTMSVRSPYSKQTNNGCVTNSHRSAAEQRRDLRPERADGDDRRERLDRDLPELELQQHDEGVGFGIGFLLEPGASAGLADHQRGRVHHFDTERTDLRMP